ncbi:hypothetical protein [Streptomyces sp. NRRL B-3229]|uniref:hypothetical protein n=1 Tax=Streptomyces sp. NRRL B-3229 TaxID=1463836 RepID=UPI0004C07E62|nr:hypothetical protein [Streptomyces sp. NRRL B-3229]
MATQASPTATPTLSSTNSVTLPVEDYLLKNDEDAEMLYASKILVRQCMARFGFDYAVDPGWKSPSDPKGDAANMARRYGVSDATTAARYGYHLPTNVLPAPPADAQPMSDAARDVFLGDNPRADGGGLHVKQYQGQKIPAHGCSGEAERKLGTGLDERLPESINDASFQQSMAAPQVNGAFRSWSACMRKNGYTFSTPLEPLRTRLSASPTASEIHMAESDVACKKKTNLVGIWVAVESTVQKSLIEKNQEGLTQVRSTARQTLERSAKVIAEGASS